MMMPYERFQAWQSADALAYEVYQTTAAWPRAETYGLTAQARRAAVSVAVNLVEGSGRLGAREFARFVDIALASLSELSYLLRFANRLGYLNDADHQRLDAMRALTSKLLWGLVRSLRPRHQTTPRV